MSALVETILADAVEISSPGDRHRFVEQACGGDPNLLHEVSRLVACHFEAGDFLESCAVETSGFRTAETGDGPGSQIGPYQLLEFLGDGGFGVVFRAEQSSPIRRMVALKLLKLGMDTRQFIARFEAERQALALMDHPNIAMVLDAGSTDTGRPYFVMELVNGVPINRFCDERQLSLPERLRLFLVACEAIQHAHQRGIIHRDIKPTNVLVAWQDGRPQLKVIDFGVAKSIGFALTNDTVVTGAAQMVGTPLYMSPEQATLGFAAIDTRSDVYCLGGMLYELLTGTTPLEKHALRAAGADETRRMIREVDPPRPSVRVHGLSAETLAETARQRQCDPSRLAPSLRGELDWIVMKALEKDRDRRYESVRELANDVQHFLHDEPIAACPPTALHRLRKFARRNRWLLITMALVTLALLTGISVATWQAVVANAERARAQAAEQGQRQQTERAMNLLYATEMRLASQHLLAGDDEQTRTLLEHWLPERGATDRRGLEWQLLRHSSLAFGDELLRLSGASTAPDGSTTSDVSCVRVAPDQSYVVAATDGGLIRRYDLDTRRELPMCETALEDVRRIEFSPDGHWLAAISYLGEIAVVDCRENRRRFRFPKPERFGGNADVMFSSQGSQLLSIGESGQICTWDLERGVLSQRWNSPHANNLDCAAVPELNGFALLGKVGDVAHYEATLHGLPDGHRLGGLSFGFHSSCLAVSRNGKFLAVGGTQGRIEVWDWKRSERLAEMELSEKINELEFSADGRRLAVAERTGVVHVWRWPSNAASNPVAESHESEIAPTSTRRGPTSPKSAKAESQEAKVTPDSTPDLAVDLQAPQLESAAPDHVHWMAHARPARSVVFAPDQRHVITAGFDGRIVRWKADYTPSSRTAVQTDELRAAWVGSRHALSLLNTQGLWLIDPKSGATITKSDLPTQLRKRNVVCASNGRLVAWSTSPGPLLCRDTLLESAPVTLAESETPVEILSRLEFLSGTPRLAAILRHPVLELKTWDAENGRLLVQRRFEAIISGLTAVSATGHTLLVLSERTLHAIDLDSGNLLSSRNFDGRDANCFAIAPQNELLAVGGKNRRIDLVDPTSLQVSQTLIGHLGAIEQVQFTADGRTLLALDGRGVLKFWQIACGVETMALTAREPIRWFSLSPDGHWLVLGLAGGTEIREAASLEILP